MDNANANDKTQVVPMTQEHRGHALTACGDLRKSGVSWPDVFMSVLAAVDFLASMTNQPPHMLIDNAICALAQLERAKGGKFSAVVLRELAALEVERGEVH